MYETEKQAFTLREKKYRHINRIYQCLREISRLALSEWNHGVFIQKACKYLISQREYNYAWITLRNADGIYDTAVEAGLGETFDLIREQLVGGDLPECCTEALNHQKVYVVKDSDKQCPGCPLGYMHQTSAVMSARIEYDHRIFGVLTVSVLAEYLDDEEIALFSEVASDIGLALTRFKGAEFDRWFKSIFDNLPQTFSLISSDYRYLAVNEMHSKVFGLKREDILGNRVKDFYPEKIWKEIIKPRLDLCRRGRSLEFDFKIERGDSGLRYIKLLYFPYREDPETKEVTAIIAQGLDLTEQRKIEGRLESSENRFRQLIETASDTITVLSLDGYITDINDSACRQLGKAKEQLLGQPVTVLDRNYSPKTFREFWEKIPPGKNTILESSHTGRDGTPITVEICARKVLLDGEEYIMNIARDISERKRDHEKLLNALEKAKESDRLKSAFLANMSHEIRTPLNGILGFSSLMSEPGISPEKLQQYSSIIQQSGQRLLTTINDLIDISRIEAGMVETWITEISPEELIDELYGFFKPDIETKGIEFILEKDETEECSVIHSDRDKLYAIMVNLLKNSVKFTETGFIRIGYNCTDGEIELFVKDSGIGIPADKIETIFDRFIQADQSLTKPYEGSGLGLSICREYAELIGGSLRVESEYGKGAGFFLKIPIEGAESSDAN